MDEPDGRTLAICETLAATFAPRRDLYNRWTGTGYVTVREGLTAPVIFQALTTGRAVGAFFPGENGRTHVGALDLDREDGLALALLIGAAAGEHRIPTVVVPSEGGRAHLWLVVDADWAAGEPCLPAAAVLAALRGLVKLAGVDPKLDGLEYRPERADSTGIGKALRLPTMPHRRTGRRGPMLDGRTGRPLGATLGESIENMELATPADVAVVSMFAPTPAPAAELFRQPAGDDSIVAVLSALGTAAVPGRAVRCPFHDDRTPSARVAPDDRRYWCWSTECIAYGPHGWTPAELAGLRS